MDTVAKNLVVAAKLRGHTDRIEPLIYEVYYLLAPDADNMMVLHRQRIIAYVLMETSEKGDNAMAFKGIQRFVDGRGRDCWMSELDSTIQCVRTWM